MKQFNSDCMNGVVQCIPDCDVNADTVAWLPKQETFFVNYIHIEEKKSLSFLFIPPVKGLKQIPIGMLGRKASKSTKKTAAAKFSIGRIFFPVFL